MSEVWFYEAGKIPYKVTVLEMVSRRNVLYLRWREQGNWKVESLGRTLRTESGRIIKAVEEWAKQKAEAKHLRLVQGGGEEPEPILAPLSIAGASALVKDAHRGLYPKDTAHRREVLRALDDAARIWGPERPWNSIRKADLRELARKRVAELKQKGKVGLRGAEVTVGRVLTVAQFLREEGHIRADACLPERNWHKRLAEELEAPEPQRPRHTVEEMRAILRAAFEIDPRYGLLLALGAELRLGQVRRCRRSDLDLEAGSLRVPGRSKKKAPVELLTPGQLKYARAALETGYLRELEGHYADYPLFPAGQLRGGRSGNPRAIARHAEAKPIDRRTCSEWFQQAEQKAGVTHIFGRGAYGIRRVAVDAAVERGISQDALKEHGGWTDTQMPERIYREQERLKAKAEARDVRASIRGEDLE
jgi:integrase